MQSEILGTLFSLLEQYGVDHVICSPGSRNAALLRFSDAYKNLKKWVVIDERSAAFMAAGIAMVRRSPVALICTSGSAVLNYAPAVAEAFYQGLPLIIISADRPVEWIDQDDSQTIRQPGVLSHVVKGSYDLDAENSELNYPWYANRIINEGLQLALKGKQGPVHFNIRLSGIVETKEPEVTLTRKISTITPPSQLNSTDIKVWGDLLSCHKVMVVAGFMPPDHKLQKAVLSLASLPNVCIMAETVSNLHLPRECYMIDTTLFPLTYEEIPVELKPDILISLGGALISRKLKEFLRKNPPRMFHLGFNEADNVVDCFQSLDYKLNCNPASFLQAISKRMKRMGRECNDVPHYAKVWNDLRCSSLKPLKNIPWSDLRALNIVLNRLPEDTNLFLSNGTSVRYAQIIPQSLPHATYANRGVSGIEGSTSTAVGASLVYPGLTCLVTGDMSFSYDLAGLSSGLESNKMRIVLLDNGGGDIFRFIPATKDLEIREEYLCAPKNFSVGLLADAFGWIYYYADNEQKLKENLNDFFEESFQPAILHIDTRNVKNNAEILSKFLK